ncbi:MAG: HEAT repeat domain-containing protein [Bacteroidota bacterium]
MNLEIIFADKLSKPKEKIEVISKALLDKKISFDALILFAVNAKDPIKASCIEALEFATKTNPKTANLKCLEFVSQTLTSKAPRVKWESARVVGNIAHLFPDKLNTAVKNLLLNSEHEGTVVRWSAAFALGEIIKLKSKKYASLIPAAEAICKREEKNSIIKIYQAAIKKTSKS